MNPIPFSVYRDILHHELVPAMGCTEPISIAYAAALARQTLGCMPETVRITVSANIIKNVKSVVVPHTGGMHGIEAAAAAGIVAGRADRELEVIAEVSREQIAGIAEFLSSAEIVVEPAKSCRIFDMTIEVQAGEHSALVSVEDNHSNVVRIEKDGSVLFSKESGAQEGGAQLHYDKLSVRGIVEYADHEDLEQVRALLERQIEYNSAIAKEGLDNEYGACIGRILLRAYGNSVSNRAKAWAAAASDARMAGCELPVVINSGSGNQGLTTSLPVVVYAKELNVSHEQLLRALLVSNLVTIHLKTGIGTLSAYCGATSAGCGAGAGIAYLYGGRYEEISHTIVNAVAINSGMTCDGAKASCAAKIASAVEAGLLGMQMNMHGSQFHGGDGIVEKGVENTIENIGLLAREGMAETDKKIIDIMLGNI